MSNPTSNKSHAEVTSSPDQSCQQLVGDIWNCVRTMMICLVVMLLLKASLVRRLVIVTL